MTLRLIQTLGVLTWVGLVACQTPVSAPKSEAPTATTMPAAQPPQEPATVSQGDTLNAWCRVTGEVGERLLCPLTLDATTSSQSASGIQLRVHWSPTELSFLGVESTVCAPGGTPCASVTSPPSKAIGRLGHSLATNPPDVKTADGAATLMIYHGSNPNAALEGALGALVFEARRPVKGAEVRLDSLAATAADARSLTLRTVGQTLQLAP
jgi:hypothetical protein